ncbi:hypothetical protein BO71DRAFT_436902 [Aspergillus ellipticus CBS 707.79]|uniref:Uncharacterized protein n=1 Tax=Aspergillus ellipticus CBS 707.79 TaxID=1448320 RepID=A0A319DR08_9EURO|nr:hypothetical protein BO71DRAFT_436902 [Aspergillus ellipticus CBS 707.79]
MYRKQSHPTEVSGHLFSRVVCLNPHIGVWNPLLLTLDIYMCRGLGKIPAWEGSHFPESDIADFPDEFCTLLNENLFQRKQFLTLRGDAKIKNLIYSKIEPALLPASRLIIHRWDSYIVFIRRHQPDDNDVFITEDHREIVTKEEVMAKIQEFVPSIELDPDMYPESSGYAMTVLYPGRAHDLVVLDYNLISVLLSSKTYDSNKIAAMVVLAVLLGHEMAHILEFRGIRKAHLDNNSEPFITPPGITCPEAGTALERYVFGGKVQPVCTRLNDLMFIQGLYLNSSAIDYKMMKMNQDWIRGLFSERHWETAPKPTEAPLVICVQRPRLKNYLFKNDSEDSQTKGRINWNDVRVETGSPTRRPKMSRPNRRFGCKVVDLTGL